MTEKLLSNVLQRNGSQGSSGGAALRSVGSLDLLDLQIINQSQGRDPLQFPFMLTRPTRFEWADDMAVYAATVPDRVRYGDLSAFSRCLDALVSAEVTVAAHVQFIPADTVSTRLLAFRIDQSGFLMTQRADADVLDIHSMPATELAGAVAGRMPCSKPGGRRRIVIPEYTERAQSALREPVETQSDTEFEAESVVIRHDVPTSTGVRVSANDVAAFATVQSHWLPPRTWGVDWQKAALVWVRIADDGDYLAASDYSHGVPMTLANLTSRIDALIAEDLANVTNARGDW